MTSWPIRLPDDTEVVQLAQLWHDGWQDAHAEIVPESLVAIRTPEDFAARLPDLLPLTRTAGPKGAPLGLCIVDCDEIYQFYVAREARGIGLAAQLLREGVTRIASGGYRAARLDVAIGNKRAERFYEKNGWQVQGPLIAMLRSTAGEYPLEVLRMTKPLS